MVRAARAAALGKHQRVLARSEYLGIQKAGRRFSRGSLTLVVGKTPAGRGPGPRLGLVVSRKVGSAVQRNLLKRWIREWFRTHVGELPRGLDLVVIPKASAGPRGHRLLDLDLLGLASGLSALRSAGSAAEGGAKVSRTEGPQGRS